MPAKTVTVTARRHTTYVAAHEVATVARTPRVEALIAFGVLEEVDVDEALAGVPLLPAPDVDLDELTVAQLREEADRRDVDVTGLRRKDELVDALRGGHEDDKSHEEESE